MDTVKGIITCEFEVNTYNNSMIVKTGVHTDDALAVEVLLRAYVALGANLQKINQKVRYGINNEKEAEKIAWEITQELEREL